MKLWELPEAALDYIISLPPRQRKMYLKEVVTKHYPSASQNEDILNKTIKALESSVLLEKLYRNNEFLKENFTLVYANGGIIRNMVQDAYYSEEDLTIH
tara:strand:+ start:1120 stop:1416 length:297 start_codon:yes stop_codon:yes gene_type:complete